MNELVQLGNDLTRKRELSLILTQNSARTSKTDLIAHLILKGPLFVISGDEWLPAFALPRIIRRHTTQVKAIMGRLYTVRASTCYRLLDSLSSTAPNGEPILVLELLNTFYDEDIHIRTRLIKFRDCCRELKRLSYHRPVMVMMWELQDEDYEKFLPALSSITDRTVTLETELEQITQPTLF